MTPSRLVRTTDNLNLAVYEHGDPSAATIVAIHGYPDNASVWEPVIERLRDRFHVVSYDVRGAGQSDRPAGRAGYRLDQLEADFSSVLDAVSPDRPVHLLGHDWGSILGWQCVASDRLQGRIASYTSISGPGLDQAAHWVRSKLRPSGGDLATVAKQLAHSSYLVFFQLPALPELAWRSGLLDRLLGAGRRAPAVHSTADRINGLGLYRANLGRRHRVSTAKPIDIPVQVLAPTADPFVGAALQTEAPQPYVRDLRVRLVPGGHWIMRRSPDLVAQACAELVDEVERR